MKHACMYLGARECHRLISLLWVGETLPLALLATISIAEVLLGLFLWRAWQTRARTRPIRAVSAEVTERSLRLLVSAAAPESQDISRARHGAGPVAVPSEALT
jgi:hypothetical protein